LLHDFLLLLLTEYSVVWPYLISTVFGIAYRVVGISTDF
jgi:hypothetical protein